MRTTKQPENLEEVIDSIIEASDAHELNEWANKEEGDAVVSIHFSAGMGVRNAFGLWEANTLTKYFRSIGIKHADDISGIIYTSLHRKLNAKDIDLPGQVCGYWHFWKTCPNFDGKNEGVPDMLPNKNGDISEEYWDLYTKKFPKMKFRKEY